MSYLTITLPAASAAAIPSSLALPSPGTKDKIWFVVKTIFKALASLAVAAAVAGIVIGATIGLSPALLATAIAVAAVAFAYLLSKGIHAANAYYIKRQLNRLSKENPALDIQKVWNQHHDLYVIHQFCMMHKTKSILDSELKQALGEAETEITKHKKQLIETLSAQIKANADEFEGGAKPSSPTPLHFLNPDQIITYVDKCTKRLVRIQKTIARIESEPENKLESEKRKLKLDALNQVFKRLQLGEDAAAIAEHNYCLLKAERIEEALKLVEVRKKENYRNAAYLQTAERVSAYFLDLQEKVDLGKNITLPDFYHAVRSGDSGLQGIVSSGFIKQARSNSYATYVSTNDEGGAGGYGCYTFGIDQDCLMKSYVNYLRPVGLLPQQYDVKYSTWCPIKMDIPVTSDSIAYVAVEVEEHMDWVSRQLKAAKIDVPVIHRTTSNLIRHILHSIETQRPFPPNWR